MENESLVDIKSDIKDIKTYVCESQSLQLHTLINIETRIDFILTEQLKHDYIQTVLLFLILLTYIFNSILKRLKF